MNRNLILAIETGIGGGSVSLLSGGREIDFWKGNSGISKSEDLLASIETLFSKNRIDKKDIKIINVSRGPGSFTGVRTGLATAFGLQKALGCRLQGVSVLESMTLRTDGAGKKMTGFSIGKNDVCWQGFEVSAEDGFKPDPAPRIANLADFGAMLHERPDTEFILTKDLLEKLRALDGFTSLRNIFVFEENHAKYIGLWAAISFPGKPSDPELSTFSPFSTFSTTDITPIYARDAGIR